MRKYNYITDSYEDDGQIDFMSGGPQMLEQQSVVPKQQVDMDPVIKEYLMNKMNPAPIQEDVSLPELKQSSPGLLDKYSPEKYQEALSQMKNRQSDTGLAQLAAGIGDALARRDSSSSDKYFQDVRSNIQDQTVGEFNRKKAGAIGDIKTKRDLDKNDPNSQGSANFRKTVEATMPNIVKAYGEKWNLVTEADKDSILEFGKMREQLDARRHEMQLKKQYQNEVLNEKHEQKLKLSDKQVGEIATHDKAIAAIDDIISQKKNWDTGKLSMGLNKIGGMLGIDDADKSAFKSAVGEQLAGYIKSISGATVSPTERASLLENVPSVYDNDETFMTKAKALKSRLESTRKIELDSMEKQGKNVENFKKADVPKKENTTNKPKSIKQNGVTYTLNESTGEYE